MSNPQQITGQFRGGPHDGAQARGLMLDAPPVAVLIVTKAGGVLAQSPAGLDDDATLRLLRRALDLVEARAPEEDRP